MTAVRNSAVKRIFWPLLELSKMNFRDLSDLPINRNQRSASLEDRCNSLELDSILLGEYFFSQASSVQIIEPTAYLYHLMLLSFP